jgi:coenzyme PQQ synthesis protein D (PqqD)
MNRPLENAMPGKIVSATRISRDPAVITTEVDGDVVMMSIERGLYFGLDDIGSDIWRRLETPRSFEELADELTASYDGDRSQIIDDLRQLLTAMIARGVLRRS